MPLSINTKTYNPDSFQKDTVSYDGPAKSVSIKDTVKLSRTTPKPIATFSGAGKSFAKLTRTVALTGAATLSDDVIVDISVRVPVGASDAAVDAVCDDMGEWMTSAQFKALAKAQKINQ